MKARDVDDFTQVKLQLVGPKWLIREIAAGLRNRSHFHTQDGNIRIANRLKQEAADLERKL